jgi:NAD+ diphosphatase
MTEVRRVLPHVALSEHAHDRHGVLRTDEHWLDERWADPATRVLVIAGARVRPVEGRLRWVSPQEAPDGLRVLLGERDGVEHFAVIVDPDVAPGNRDEWVVLRAIVQSLADETIADGPLVLHAIGLAEWLWATKHCPRCGGALEPRQAGHVLHCTTCGRDQFPRSDPAVIMVVTDGEPGSPDERALLGRSPAWPPGRFSTLAGFVEPGETMEDAVRREVEEELGVTVGEVQHVFDVFMSPGSVTERLHLFAAPYSPADRTGDRGGLEEEGEDIEVVELDFDEALDMIDDGRIADGKTVMLLYWAALRGPFRS